MKENFNSQTIFLGEFLSNRTENVYPYSSKCMKGPKALHFPKFSENTVFLPKMSVFRIFFYWILIKKINSKLQEIKKKLHMDFHLKNFPKFSESRKFFFGN